MPCCSYVSSEEQQDVNLAFASHNGQRRVPLGGAPATIEMDPCQALLRGQTLGSAGMSGT